VGARPNASWRSRMGCGRCRTEIAAAIRPPGSLGGQTTRTPAQGAKRPHPDGFWIQVYGLGTSAVSQDAALGALRAQSLRTWSLGRDHEIVEPSLRRPRRRADQDDHAAGAV